MWEQIKMEKLLKYGKCLYFKTEITDKPKRATPLVDKWAKKLNNKRGNTSRK